MSRYVIKNCPALIKEAFQNNQIDGVATTAQISKNLCFGNTCIHCADCTDCKIKQVIENLRQVAYACHCDNCDGCGYYEGCGDTECGTYQALKSLELFNIEECE